MNGLSEDLVEATVVEALPNAMFRVRMRDGREVSASVTGNMRVQFTRLVAGDKILVQLSPFDPTKTRIVQPSMILGSGILGSGIRGSGSGGESSQPQKEFRK